MALNSEDIKTAMGTNEISHYKTLSRQLFAEFIGTFMFLSIVLFAGTNVNIQNINIAFANGLLIASIVQIIYPVSGGHLNPAITIGALICGHIKVLRAVLYVIVQIFGSIAGSAVAYALCDEDSRGNLSATIPYDDLRDYQVFGIEFLTTFVLVSVFLSVFDKNRHCGQIGPLAVGFSLTACQAAALNYTGSLNPIRSLGPAVVMNIWPNHWVYWVGPLLGGLVAGLVYKFAFTLRSRNVMIVE